MSAVLKKIEASLAAHTTAQQAVQEMMNKSAIAFTSKGMPKGCLLASATISGPGTSADVKRAVGRVRRRITLYIAARIDKDIEEGRLPQATDSQALSDMVMSVILGMSALAREGICRERLLKIVAQSMCVWPKVS